jgi:transcriptional regulator GlxA family with amidase domain
MKSSSGFNRRQCAIIEPVAQKTLFAGFTPNCPDAPGRHVVAVLAFDGVVLSDLATPCDIFGRVRDSKERLPYDVRVCGMRSRISTEHIRLDVPWRLATLHRADTIMVPGIDRIDRSVPEELIRALRRAVARGVRVASICTGAFVLARSGVLSGLKATTHWLAAEELARRYPEIDVNANVLYVDNGRILTSAGAAAGLDLCLHLVRRDLGAEIAANSDRLAVMPLERTGGQAQFIVHDPPTANDKTAMGPLLLWIEKNVHKELSLPVIARQAAMSTRTLSRRFVERVGATPAQWVAAARVRRVQQLLETTGLSIEEVAARSGFRSASVLREHFGGVVGTTPIAYRKSFGFARQR